MLDDSQQSSDRVSRGRLAHVLRRDVQVDLSARDQPMSQQVTDAFVNDYVDRARRHINTGITALVPAGVFRLESDSEIREAFATCEKQLGKHPLGAERNKLDGVDLKQFFAFAAERKVNFATRSVEEVLSEIGRDAEH